MIAEDKNVDSAEQITEAQIRNSQVLEPRQGQAIRNPQFAIRNGKQTLLVLLLFLVLTVAMTWPWALHMGEAINPFGDVVLQMATLRWDAHALITNSGGLFEAPFFYPYAHSIAFSEHLIGETLVTLPLLLLTGNPALSYNINVLLSFVLTGFFTYLLVRDLTGSRAAGLLASVAFAFCPFRFMQMGHLHMLATAWFPFTLWALFRWTRGQGSGVRGQGLIEGESVRPDSRPLTPDLWFFAALLGFLAMGLFSVYYTFFLLLVVLLWVVWTGAMAVVTGEWRGWRIRARPVVWGLAGIIAVGVMLLPVFVPYAQTSADLGLVRTTYELENWSAEWTYFGKVLQSNWLYGNLLAPGMASSLGERELFFGFVPSLLALVGLVWGRGRQRFYFALLGVFALLMTFGLSGQIPGTDITVPLPYAFFYDFLPGFKALRVPVRFAVLLDFSIYVLAGYGVAVLARRWTIDDGRKFSIPHPMFRISHSSIVYHLSSIVLIGLVLLEFANPLDVSNRRDVTAQIATTEPYGWLARPENAGPIMELPFNPDQGDVQAMLFDTRDWQPIVNGWSGFVPPGTVELSRAMSAFPDPATVSLLQGLEVRHVLVHLWQFPQADQAALKKRLDSTKELSLVDQAGDNYVYRLAPDPWLRDIAGKLGSDKTIWIGEARQGTLPTLEVLAYALNRMGVRWDQMGGNINIGYRPIGQLPFGTLPDYALVPNDGTPMDKATPIGMTYNNLQYGNAAVRVLENQTIYRLISGPGLGLTYAYTPDFFYDMTRPDAPNLNATDINLSTDAEGIIHFSPLVRPFWQSAPISKSIYQKEISLFLLAATPSKVTLQGLYAGNVTAALPVGISCYSTFVANQDGGTGLHIASQNSDVHLLALGQPCESVSGVPNPLATLLPGLLPLEVTPSKTTSTLDTRMRAIAPSGNGDFTATIDVYIDPWGTHPDGHFGSWSVVLPSDGAAHDYTFRLDPLAKTVTTVRDGQPTQTFAWIGPPTQGDFRASLVVSDKAGQVANVPLYIFTLNGSRLTDWQLSAPSLSITPVR
jgi:hypothetical protein